MSLKEEQKLCKIIVHKKEDNLEELNKIEWPTCFSPWTDDVRVYMEELKGEEKEIPLKHVYV